MPHSASLASLSPVVVVHLVLAVAALVLGPIALNLRKGSRGHRAIGYAWVTLMIGAALSSVFIRDFRLPNLAGYTPIHILVPVSLLGLFGAFRKLAQGDIAGHRKLMRNVYFGACVVAGAFTLLPSRYLGQLVWSSVGLV